MSYVEIEAAAGLEQPIVSPRAPIGLVAGYYRGWIDPVISRLTDVLLASPSSSSRSGSPPSSGRRS